MDSYYSNWSDREKPGWHEYKIYATNSSYIAFMELSALYYDIIRWLIDSIENPNRHARWVLNGTSDITVRFRYERDYLMFVLRWGC